MGLFHIAWDLLENKRKIGEKKIVVVICVVKKSLKRSVSALDSIYFYVKTAEMVVVTFHL